ncbi:MAG TPA: LysR family transcriptional regulator [Nevskia sp.]|jgi:DNA-binding transcriptional LysR family regulator|nr:LysR family transcriptional regulator [Nevskia sp.]
MRLPRTSLENWAVLAAVVDQGSFAQAATALHKSQSAVSYAIARLHEALDLPLLEIEGRKAVLTAHGETLLKRARPLLGDLETLEALAAKLKQGWEAELRLVVDVAFPRSLLLNIVSELQVLCPSTQMQLSDAVLSGAEEAIEDFSADIVVATRVPPGAMGEFLLNINFVGVASPAHPLLRLERTLGVEDLVRHVQVVVRDSGTRRPRSEGWLGAERRCTVSSMEASLATVRAGLGFAWLPEHIVADCLRNGELMALPMAAGGCRQVPLHAVLVRPELAGPAARTALESFQRHLPSR